MDTIPVYLNITAEGARINPQHFDSDEHAQMMFLSWRTNDTVLQALVVGSERIKYYHNNTEEGQQWFEEEALIIRFGPLLGHVPLSEAGINNPRQMSRYYNRYIAVTPDRFNPSSDERPLYLFSRRRALESMQNANLPKMEPNTTWNGVISRRLPRGYIVNIGGFPTWMPLSLVDYQVVQPRELALGEMVTVKILPERSGRLIVVSRKDAEENPYDLHSAKYARGGNVIGQVRVVRGSNGYAVLHDGVQIRFRRGGERDIFRVGSWVSVRITGKNDDEKVLIGTVQNVLPQPVA